MTGWWMLILGLMIGFALGFVAAGLMAASSRGDDSMPQPPSTPPAPSDTP